MLKLFKLFIFTQPDSVKQEQYGEEEDGEQRS